MSYDVRTDDMCPKVIRTFFKKHVDAATLRANRLGQPAPLFDFSPRWIASHMWWVLHRVNDIGIDRGGRLCRWARARGADTQYAEAEVALWKKDVAPCRFCDAATSHRRASCYHCLLPTMRHPERCAEALVEAKARFERMLVRFDAEIEALR